MTEPFDFSTELANFAGRAPLFPLPNVVCFPHALLPLHIFEERYRQMVRDALAGDRLLAMALLEPGYEATYYEKTPSIHRTVCLGKIVAESELADGGFNLVLHGLSRATLTAEEANDVPYRVGEMTLASDVYPREATIDRGHRQRELLTGFQRLIPKLELDYVFQYMMDEDVPLGRLCDIVAHAMQLEPDIGQRLLNEANVDLRSDAVLVELKKLQQKLRRHKVGDEFPPPFSAN